MKPAQILQFFGTQTATTPRGDSGWFAIFVNASAEVLTVCFTAANIVTGKNVDKKGAVTYIANDFPADN